MSNEDIASHVSHLGLVKSPATIARRIISVVVDSVQGMQCAGSPPHVFKKAFKARPLFTDFNSAATVKAIFLMICVSASGAHTEPRNIGNGASHAMRTPLVSGCFYFPTTARLGIAAEQASAHNCSEVSTVTAATPITISIPGRSARNNNPSVKSAPQDSDSFFHGQQGIMVWLKFNNKGGLLCLG